MIRANGWESELVHDMLAAGDAHLRMYIKRLVSDLAALQAENKELREKLGKQDPETESEDLEWSCCKRGR